MCRRIKFYSLLSCLLLALPAAASEWQYDDVGRIVALSDVHGAFLPMVRTLRNASVIDDAETWIAGDTHLVIVGDLLDRGPDSRQAMDLLMRLEREAEAAGGKVHVLIGNHEAMNLVGDLRYVSREEYAAFAELETARERDRWFAAYSERNSAEEVDLETLRATFDENFPPGYFAHRRAFSSRGEYGAWLLSKPLLVVINKIAFVHGGLSPMIAEVGLDGVNGNMRGDLVAYVENYDALQRAGVLLPTDGFYEHEDLLAQHLPALDTSGATIAAADALVELGKSDLHALDGPLWYRGNVACSRLIEQDRLDATLAAIDAERVVIGHTPTPVRRILQRFDGRIIEVDTGMLNTYYGGRGHALIIIGDAIAAVSESSTEMLGVMQHPRQVGLRPEVYMSAEAIETLLENGEIGDVRENELKRKIVTVSDGERTIEALFTKRVSRGFYPNVAAYRLDRLLELDAVPVAVVRRVHGDDGSLQFLPPRVVDETARSASGRGASANCPLDDQWEAMYVFDTLIYNEGRTQSRMTYSTDRWQLLLVGHQNAFSTKSGRPSYLQPISLNLSSAWLDTLAALSADMLEESLGDVLNKRRRQALLTRRDELLTSVQFGEQAASL